MGFQACSCRAYNTKGTIGRRQSQTTNRQVKTVREMAYTHLVSFCGKSIETTVTQKASVADSWVHDILSTRNGQNIIVGLNCKWKSHPIRSMSNKIATLQFCINTKCLILQLFCMDNIPQSVKYLLSDPNIVFVGVEVEEVVLKLKNEYKLYCNKKIDVRTLAKIHFPLSFHGKPGLKALAYQLLELRAWKPKNSYLNNMESRVLDMEQIKFACIDAYTSYRIGYKLLKEM